MPAPHVSFNEREKPAASPQNNTTTPELPESRDSSPEKTGLHSSEENASAVQQPDIPNSLAPDSSAPEKSHVLRDSPVEQLTANPEDSVAEISESLTADQPTSSESTPEKIVSEPEIASAADEVTRTSTETLNERPQTSTTEETSRGRKEQPRQPQMRQHRERTRNDAALNKGLKPVNRKFRIDSPGDANSDSDRPRNAESPQESETNVAGARIQSNSANTGRRHRIDDGQPVSDLLGTGDSRGRTHARPRRRYIDEAHPATARGPHFQVTPQRRSNFTSMTGQFLAYLGVLGLTIGTAMVIYGHFGGYSDYTPTGWLVTTVAQMMLFLGVINLVSGGMEQTNDEVSQRINTLGEQLFRIEQVTEEVLRGPKINPRRYANPDEEYEDSQREVASVRDRE